MNFNNPKVRQRILEHLVFATSSVTAVRQEISDNQELETLVRALEVNLALTILNYTLQMDYKLKNSLMEIPDNLGE